MASLPPDRKRRSETDSEMASGLVDVYDARQRQIADAIQHADLGKGKLAITDARQIPAFARALPLSDLLNSFAITPQPAPAAQAAGAAASANAPDISQQPWSEMPRTLAELSAAQMAEQAIQLFAEEDAADMGEFRCDVLSSEHVSGNLGCESYGGVAKCRGSPCLARNTALGSELCAWVSQKQRAHMNATGTLVGKEHRFAYCYLCLLFLANTARAVEIDGTYPGLTTRIPFCHPHSVPGGWVADAVWPPTPEVPTSLRKFNLTDYVTSHVDTLVPTTLASNGYMLWEWTNIKTLREKAEKIHGATQCAPIANQSNAFNAVAYAEIPSLGDIIRDELIDTAHMSLVDVNTLCSRQENIPTLACWPVSLRRSFSAKLLKEGPTVTTSVWHFDKPKIKMPNKKATHQEVLYAIAFSEFEVARAIIVQLVAEHQGNVQFVIKDLLGVQLGVMPGVTAFDPEKINKNCPFDSHTFLWILLFKRSLAEYLMSSAFPAEIGGPVYSRAVIEKMSKPSVRRQMHAYRTSLTGMLLHFDEAIGSERDCSDKRLFEPGRDGVLEIINLKFNNQAIYAFEGIDLVTHKPTVVAVPAVSPSQIITAALQPDYLDPLAHDSETVVAAAMAATSADSRKKRTRPYSVDSNIFRATFCPFSESVVKLAAGDSIQFQQGDWVPQLFLSPLSWKLANPAALTKPPSATTTTSSADPPKPGDEDPAPPEPSFHLSMQNQCSEISLLELGYECSLCQPEQSLADAAAQFNEALCAAIEAKAPNVRVWRAIVMRIRVAYRVLNYVLDMLRDTDVRLAIVANRPRAFLADNQQGELAARIVEAIRGTETPSRYGFVGGAADRGGIVDLCRDIVPRLIAMPAIDQNAAECYEEQARLTRASQALKRFISAHSPLVMALMTAGAITDDQCTPHLYANPVSEFCEMSLCMETMICTAGVQTDIQFAHSCPKERNTHYTRVMAQVLPDGLSVMEFSEAFCEAVHAKDEFSNFAAECLFATVCGMYPHSRYVANFNTWLDCHCWWQAAPKLRAIVFSDFFKSKEFVVTNPAQPGGSTGPKARGRTTAARKSQKLPDSHTESSERLFFTAMRENYVVMCPLTSLRVYILSVYPRYTEFEKSVTNQCNLMRQITQSGRVSISVLDTTAAECYNSASQWHTFHKPPAHPFQFFSECFREVTLTLIISACIQRCEKLPRSFFEPTHRLLFALEAFIKRIPTYKTFDKRWLVIMGVSQEAADNIAVMIAQHQKGALAAVSGQEHVRRLHREGSYDYQLCAIIFHLLALRWRTATIRLDDDTARRQEMAIRMRPHLAFSLSARHAIVSSMLCCYTLRTFTKGPMSGNLPVRWNVTTNEHTCVVPKSSANSSARQQQAQKKDTTGRDDVIIDRYRRARENGMNGEYASAAAKMNDCMRSWAQWLMKGMMKLSCGDCLVDLVPVVGRVYVHRVSATVIETCTICPMCGVMTTFEPHQFGINGFSCNRCQPYMVEEYLANTEEQCVECGGFMTALAADSKQSGLDKTNWQRPVHKMPFVDDVSVPGMAMTRRVSVCKICNPWWLRESGNNVTLGQRDVLKKCVGIDHLLDVIGRPHIDEHIKKLEAMAEAGPTHTAVPKQPRSATDMPNRQYVSRTVGPMKVRTEVMY